MKHAAGCECVECLIPDDDAPKCKAHKRCAGRDGHGGERVGIRRGIRVALREMFKPGQRA